MCFYFFLLPKLPLTPGKHLRHCEEHVFIFKTIHNTSLLSEKLKGAEVDRHLAAWTTTIANRPCEAS